MNKVVFNLWNLLERFKRHWVLLLICLLAICLKVFTYKNDRYVYSSEVSGVVETLPSTYGGEFYSGIFKLRLDDDQVVDVNTPALFGVNLGEKIIVKKYVSSTSNISFKYQYVPPENTGEDCFAPCEPIKVGR